MTIAVTDCARCGTRHYCCVALDRAVRDAARLHAGSITEAHEATASRIVAEVGL